jgi:hypothetical protein
VSISLAVLENIIDNSAAAERIEAQLVWFVGVQTSLVSFQCTALMTVAMGVPAVLYMLAGRPDGMPADAR